MLRIRKGIKQIGPIIAHFGIILLLFTGFVDHHKSIHGHMDTRQFGTYDYAWKRGKTSLEVFQFDEEQNKKPPYVIKHEMLEDLSHDNSTPKHRVFKISEFPFDIEVRNFYANAQIATVSTSEKQKLTRPKTSIHSLAMSLSAHTMVQMLQS